MHDTGRGIKQNCQTALTVLSECARFSETALKQLAVMQSRGLQNITEQDFDTLCLIWHAGINFQQEKFSKLVAKSSFDQDTNRFFDCVEANPTACTTQTRDYLCCAVELSAAMAGNSGQPGSYNTAYRGRLCGYNYRGGF